jgi:hypothetical protein
MADSAVPQYIPSSSAPPFRPSLWPQHPHSRFFLPPSRLVRLLKKRPLRRRQPAEGQSDQPQTERASTHYSSHGGPLNTSPAPEKSQPATCGLLIGSMLRLCSTVCMGCPLLYPYRLLPRCAEFKHRNIRREIQRVRLRKERQRCLFFIHITRKHTPTGRPDPSAARLGIFISFPIVAIVQQQDSGMPIR